LIQEGCHLFCRQVQGLVEQLFQFCVSPPAQGSLASSRPSQAFTNRHLRSTVLRETSQAWAISPRVSPVN
jgi:hypothetical protein